MLLFNVINWLFFTTVLFAHLSIGINRQILNQFCVKNQYSYRNIIETKNIKNYCIDVFEIKLKPENIIQGVLILDTTELVLNHYPKKHNKIILLN